MGNTTFKRKLLPNKRLLKVVVSMHFFDQDFNKIHVLLQVLMFGLHYVSRNAKQFEEMAYFNQNSALCMLLK